jgi:hypothetical protein
MRGDGRKYITYPRMDESCVVGPWDTPAGGRDRGVPARSGRFIRKH